MGRFSDPGTGMSVVGTEATYPLVAVAIDNNSKVSQGALKWTLEHLVKRGQMLVLVHVNTKGTSAGTCDAAGYKQAEGSMRELFLPYRCFCTRKDVHCKDVVLDEPDVIKALVEFIASSAIEIMVLGAPVKGVLRFKNSDVPQSVSKGAPDFCSVYIVGKEKAVNVRKALRAAPSVSPLRPHMSSHNPSMSKSESSCALGPPKWPAHKAEHVSEPGLPSDNSIKSPFTRGTSNLSSRKSFGDFSPLSDATDISFISSGRPSLDRYGFQPRLSNGSDSTFEHSFEMVRTPNRFSNGNDYSSFSQSSNASYSSQNMDDVESEIRRLRMELKQTMDMYSTACREALDAKQKLTELERHKLEEQKILCEARTHEEAAMQMIEEERAKRKAAVEAAEKSNRLAELEAKKRYSAEMLALKEAEEKKKLISSHNDLRYRKYTIDEIELATDNFNMSRKIGEGGYGPVFKGYLDHTLVAIKVLRPDAAQGRSQFQQEVEVLSCIRHPNMVILMGACPEYGCLVYEYMASGSLDDRLFRRGGTPPIPWQHRFRIAAEVATGLLFLHQAKPEPLVHRDLKPANILLDRNYVSKISDVGLARLVPQSLVDDVTQYRMTSTAGTFCYIDPEYQQTGMLGVKSDIYSLGVLLLQIITARSPMGLTHNVSHAIENGKFADVLDPEVNDWPVEAAQRLAEIALGCAELRRKDRPDLATVVLPELLKLRLLGEENL